MVSILTNEPDRREGEVFTYKQVIDIARSIKNKRNRALFIIYYLTAGRASEVVDERVPDKKRIPLRKMDLKFRKINNVDVLLIDITNLKNRNVKFKTLPIPISKDKELIDMMMEWVETIKTDDEPIFKIGRKMAWLIIKGITGERTHFLRHTRLTHLVTMYKYDSIKLMKYAGWTDPRHANRYVHLNWEDLIY